MPKWNFWNPVAKFDIDPNFAALNLIHFHIEGKKLQRNAKIASFLPRLCLWMQELAKSYCLIAVQAGYTNTQNAVNTIRIVCLDCALDGI